MTEENTPDMIAKRRTLVTQVLAEILNTRQLESALQLWDRRYARAQSIAVIDYVGQIATQLALAPGVRHRIRVDLYRRLRESNDPHITFYRMEADSDSESLPTAPASTPAPRSRHIPILEDEQDISSMFVMEEDIPPVPEVPANEDSRSPAWVVFLVILTHIREGVLRAGRDAAGDFAFSLQQQHKSLRVGSDLYQALLAWAQGADSLAVLAQGREQDWARIVHGVYVATAEALGPVGADRLLTRSIATADMLPEARLFDPRRFL